MEEINNYINEALKSRKKLEFLTNMVTAMGYNIEDHMVNGGAETVFNATSPEHHGSFGIAVFVDRSNSSKNDRSLTIKIKSQFIEKDIENARDKVENFLDNNHIKYNSVEVKPFTSGDVNSKGITIYMSNKYCPWSND